MAYLGNRIEHRWGERIRVNIPVQVSAQTSPKVGGRMKNLSLSGALMKTECELQLHALIEVSIQQPPSPSATIVKAHVSRRLKEEVGIEWCEFAPRVVKDLLRSPAIRLPP